MKLCIIGGAGHFDYVLGGLAQGIAVDLCAVAPGSAGENLGKLEARLRELDLNPRRFADWQAMLDETRPDIVAVNPHFGDHARINAECLRRGIHLYAEKPLATTLDDLAELEKLWRGSGVHLAAMFGIRYKPWFLTAHQVVQAGAIGEVRLLHAQKSYRLGQREAFYTRRDSFGGTIPWVGSHAIDWLRWFSGQEFVSVFASHSTRANGGHGELESSAMCAFEMTGEVAATVNIDYLRPASAPSHDDDRIRVVGSAGVIEVRNREVHLLNAAGEQILPQLSEVQCFADFVASIRGEQPCLVSAEDSFLSTAASLLARHAADEKRLIRF
ncbi:MAG: gfo/Idh/MocA family oxidoreductase [Proteobacteria bacterium]|nr:gfo/Idh/MocA family oxidoreductase [Pseudomonadota bacterium]